MNINCRCGQQEDADTIACSREMFRVCIILKTLIGGGGGGGGAFKSKMDRHLNLISKVTSTSRPSYFTALLISLPMLLSTLKCAIHYFSV